MFFEFSEQLNRLAAESESAVRGAFERIEQITEHNQRKVLKAFIDCGVSESHFAPSTGYGYGDRGREVLEAVFAGITGAEDSLIRHNFVSGTHAISTALFGVLRPGDSLLSVTGQPYDTLHEVIGIKGSGKGSLKDFGINYIQHDLLTGGTVDYEKLGAADLSGVKIIYIQRSRGYSLRPSLSVGEIGKIIKTVKSVKPEILTVVDNCYGEFVEKTEPTEAGADLIIGSLIKNPGGGIAPTGGYIAGRADLVELCANRLTTPATGKEVGATLGHTRELFMGLFHAPHVTGEALKTAIFAAELLTRLGYDVTPTSHEPRADIIQAVLLGDEKSLVAFCQGMQKGAPVDSFVVPEPWDMPGYDNKVIMAAGAFTMGASIELSADAPLRPPYAAWMQGSLNYHSGKVGVLLAVQSMLDKSLL